MKQETHMKLEPMRFLPDRMERPWGRVEYALADLGYVDSMAVGGPLGGNPISDLVQTFLERLVGDAPFEQYGTQFPVMVKTLEVEGRTSLHVNPDDEAAAQRYDSFGKTALWYVTDVRPDAALYLGFREAVSPSLFYQKCLDGTVEQLLHVVHPRVGESYLIPPGLVHAAQGVTLLEVAESSELWFRLHDWARTGRECHLEEAFDLIDFGATRAPAAAPSDGSRPLVFTPQFVVREVHLRAPETMAALAEGSFRLYALVRGQVTVGSSPFAPGKVLLVPAEAGPLTLVPEGEGPAVLLEISCQPAQTPDPYIDASVAPETDDE